MSANSSLNRYRPIVVATRSCKRYRYPNKPPGRRITSCSQTPPAVRSGAANPARARGRPPARLRSRVRSAQTDCLDRQTRCRRGTQSVNGVRKGGLGGVPLVIARMAGNPTDPRTRTKGSSAVYDIIRPIPGYSCRFHQRRQARHNGTRGRVVLRP